MVNVVEFGTGYEELEKKKKNLWTKRRVRILYG